ncbi:MAG TPA: hypothetical protein VFE46_13965 [Pirellulales bacterium]|jgi:hypothetical protein|nr:hypothetical protein [Pirellulales bacterium]
MHAALLSLVLMSVSCGDTPPREVVQAVPVECVSSIAPQCNISVSYPVPAPVYGCPGCGCGGNCAVPPAYRCCPNNAPPLASTQPACETNYRPACYFYHRMFLHPADYTQPYPYREQFPYAGIDPRCQCVVPPIGW